MKIQGKIQEKTRELAQRNCEPCEGKGQPLSGPDAAAYVSKIPGWQIKDDHKTIVCELNMKNFMVAVQLIDRIAEIAEAENHHPDLHLTGYRKLTIELSTHAIGGLSENDFIVAAKINELKIKEFQQSKSRAN